MKIGNIYSFNDGLNYIKKNNQKELDDIYDAVKDICSVDCLEKISKEKRKHSLLLSPIEMNSKLKLFFGMRKWTQLDSSKKKGVIEPKLYLDNDHFLEMDGIKNKVGLEIQFGKYAYSAYDILLKMPIFHKHGLIDCGIELLPMNTLIPHMSSGVSSFNNIVTALDERGPSDLDIPVVIIGIDFEKNDLLLMEEKRYQFELDPTMLERYSNLDIFYT